MTSAADTRCDTAKGREVVGEEGEGRINRGGQLTDALADRRLGLVNSQVGEMRDREDGEREREAEREEVTMRVFFVGVVRVDVGAAGGKRRRTHALDLRVGRRRE